MFPFFYLFAQTGHEIVLTRLLTYHNRWNYLMRPKPDNILEVDLPEEDYDIGLANVPSQLNILENTSLPIVYLEHTQSPYKGVRHFSQGHKKVKHVVWGSYLVEDHWSTDRPNSVILHGLDTKDYKQYIGDKQEVISVVNGFKQREVYTNYSIWKEVTEGLPARVIGWYNDSIGGKPEGWDIMRESLSRAKVFFNSSWVFPSLSIVEALFTGIPVVSRNPDEVYKYFSKDEVLASDNNKQLREWLTKLLNKDQDYARELGSRAMYPAKEIWSKDRFVTEWNQVLERVVQGDRF